MQNQAFGDVLQATREPVSWAYAVWDQLLENLRHKVDALESRFETCQAEKNCTLIRYDIIESLWKHYDAVQDETIRARALALIESEDDMKYRKKYATRRQGAVLWGAVIQEGPVIGRTGVALRIVCRYIPAASAPNSSGRDKM